MASEPKGAKELADKALGGSIPVALAALLVAKKVITQEELTAAVVKVAHMVVDEAAKGTGCTFGDRAFVKELTDAAHRHVDESKGVAVV